MEYNVSVVIFFITIFSILSNISCASCGALEIDALAFLEKLEDKLLERKYKDHNAQFEYATNVTNENMKKMLDIFADNANFYKTKRDEILNRGYTLVTDDEISRRISKMVKIGYVVLPEDEYKEMTGAITRMQSNYAKVKICNYQNTNECNLSLEPDIEDNIVRSRNPEELKYYWKQWYDKAGKPVRKDFEKYLELSKKSANLNGFNSQAEFWIDKYEDPNFVKNLDKIYNEILPFYKELHAYSRYRLQQKYGSESISETGNIPIHLLGNLWGQNWDNIMDILVPYPEKKFFDITGEMLKQEYTPIKMFEKGDEFFQSLNMTKLPKKFWEKSILEKPKDGRDIICHASAYDMYETDDVRIKQCTKVTMSQFYVVHHELGHIQYYLQYQDQPVQFRRGPNPGFHEAVGDVVALSVLTPKHLQKIGLLNNYEESYETRINRLFQTAIKKVVFLPFAYALDKYRWAAFRGDIDKANLNCEFWKMRSNFSGIEPPVQRTENDFDPPAKYHISADVEYFTAHIFQFQFLKAACMLAGQYVPGDNNLTFDNCDFYGSAEAGNGFKKMLSLGCSKPWPDALEKFTGEREMSATALLEYFQPLRLWLHEEIVKNQIHVGWKLTDKCSTADESN